MNKSILVILIVLLFTGCVKNNAKEIVIEKIDKNKLAKIINERKGKVLFLYLWAAWNEPCKEEFPEIVKLVTEFKDVEFIGISVDFPIEIDSKIIPFLRYNNANFVTYVNDFEDDEELINFLEAKWNGIIPAAFIYDKNKKKVSFFEGKKSYDDYKREIIKALGNNTSKTK